MGQIIERPRDAAAITRHVVETTLRTKRPSARYVANDTERSTLVDQLRPNTRVLITSTAFIGVLDALVLESAPSGIELVDNDGLSHFIVARREGWRLSRFGCVDVRFDVEILPDRTAPVACRPTEEEQAEREYEAIRDAAADADDLHDRLSGHAFEIVKRATGLRTASKVFASVEGDQAAVCIELDGERVLAHVDLRFAITHVGARS